MRVWIDVDERFPDYLISRDERGKEIEVDEETLARWQKAEDDYNARADEIFALVGPTR